MAKTMTSDPDFRVSPPSPRAVTPRPSCSPFPPLDRSGAVGGTEASMRHCGSGLFLPSKLSAIRSGLGNDIGASYFLSTTAGFYVTPKRVTLGLCPVVPASHAAIGGWWKHFLEEEGTMLPKASFRPVGQSWVLRGPLQRKYRSIMASKTRPNILVPKSRPGPRQASQKGSLSVPPLARTRDGASRLPTGKMT
jgi:hypothetical protein